MATDAKTTGHGLQPDLVIFDELGKTVEADREIVDALVSSTAATDGLFLGISPKYRSPLMADYRKQAHLAHIHYVHYGADMEDDPFAPATWHKANPGLASGIKPLAYMEKRAASAASNPSELPMYLSQELNLPVSATAQMVVQLHHWQACETDNPPPPEGQAFLGLDIGESASFCAACVWCSR